jgi:hypothetical protein
LLFASSPRAFFVPLMASRIRLMAEVAALGVPFELPLDDSRMVSYSEVMLGRDLAAGELEIF